MVTTQNSKGNRRLCKLRSFCSHHHYLGPLLLYLWCEPGSVWLIDERLIGNSSRRNVMAQFFSASPYGASCIGHQLKASLVTHTVLGLGILGPFATASLPKQLPWDISSSTHPWWGLSFLCQGQSPNFFLLLTTVPHLLWDCFQL